MSLIGHSADVAAVMQALLEQPVIAGRLATLLGKSALEADDCTRLVALTALHDVGKVNLGFQLAPFEQPPPRAGHIAPMLALLYGERHADRQVLQALTADGGLGRLAHLTHGHSDNPFRAVLAHHGTLPASNGFVDPAVWRSRGGYDPIIACRDLVAAILHWLPEAAQEVPIAWTPAFGHAFAGLVTLADWLGSDETKFPFGADTPDGVDRFAASLRSARDLVGARGLAPEPSRALTKGCRWEPEVLINHATPSPAQAVMLAFPPAAEQGRITLIEDETGSGKTEAALIHFLDLFRQGRVDGLYFALPTRAAARQIHSRLKEALRRLLGPDTPHVTLAVPGYSDREAVPLAAPDALYPDDAAEARRDALWSGERPKRYLASWVAVGTIDQLLLGGLRVRHATLRSAAMLRLLLVVDEVHGSDVYMGAILRGLLDQHRRAGGHALLMSATLGASARARFFALNQRVTMPTYEAAVTTPYPAVWMDGAAVAHPTSVREPRQVAVLLEDAWDRTEALIVRAVAAARAGARVLVIRNTVRLVIETQRALEAVAPDLSFGIGTVAAPHHARYAPEDRMRLDEALEAVLGPKAARKRGSVTICSQTAEQSLDIDADLLITDLCPADVLLQRIGRLHRHRLARPPGFEQPKVIVLGPPEDSLAASLSANGAVHGGPLALGLVYADLLGVLATRRALAARPVLHIPCDNRALVEAATHETRLKDLAETLGGVWLAHWQALWGKKSAESQLADRFLIKWKKAIEPPLSDEAIKTRLGLDDRIVMLPEGTFGPFGSPISLVSLRGDWIVGVPPEAEATVSRRADGALEITLDDRAFVYDRLGLRKAADV